MHPASLKGIPNDSLCTGYIGVVFRVILGLYSGYIGVILGLFLFRCMNCGSTRSWGAASGLHKKFPITAGLRIHCVPNIGPILLPVVLRPRGCKFMRGIVKIRPRIRPRIIMGTQKGTIILTIPHEWF